MTEAQADQLIDLLSALHVLGLDIRALLYWWFWWFVMLTFAAYWRVTVQAATRQSAATYGGHGRPSQ